MPTNLDVTQPATASSQTSLPDHAIGSAVSQKNKKCQLLMSLCCLGMIACFFLPWVRILFATPSGYEIQMIPSDTAKLVLVVPLMAGLAIFCIATQFAIKLGVRLAGLTPYVALTYYHFELGEGLFQSLQIGAFFTLAFGAILLLASLLLTPEAQGSPAKSKTAGYPV